MIVYAINVIKKLPEPFKGVSGPKGFFGSLLDAGKRGFQGNLRIGATDAKRRQGGTYGARSSLVSYFSIRYNMPRPGYLFL
jgi:hypothetical protein